jgi:hypothetical protein
LIPRLEIWYPDQDAARETLSLDGVTVFFCSNRAGGDGPSDIYMTLARN